MQDNLLIFIFHKYYVLIRETDSIKPPATLLFFKNIIFPSFLSSDGLTCSGSRLLFLFKDRNSLGLQTRALAENKKDDFLQCIEKN